MVGCITIATLLVLVCGGVYNYSYSVSVSVWWGCIAIATLLVLVCGGGV